MLYYVYFSDAGVPRTGLTPAWEYLVTADNGTDKSGDAPSITEVGGGWYKFAVTFGTAPWDVMTEDLVGVIDGGASLADVERYRPVSITLRGLGLARIAHKGIQDKVKGSIDIYATNGTNKELTLELSESDADITRQAIKAI